MGRKTPRLKTRDYLEDKGFKVCNSEPGGTRENWKYC